MDKKKLGKIVDFFFEVGTLQNMRRMHSQVLRLAEETIAEHSFRTAIIAMVLAELEGVDKDKAMKMGLFHDLAEARMGDANFVHKLYVKQDEKRAYTEQLENVPGGSEITTLLDEFNECKTKEAIVAKDADRIDQILLQREYLQNKPGDFKLWHENIAKDLQTESAKELVEKIKERNPLQWVYNFAKIPPEDEK
ncbi:HD domain-containing protein [Patescibacteria group bacterium]|nr:HD domain-containing protein [Patescibacteria group bacterium]